ncbi:class I adenylate-forming enzyme family protein [Sphingomonas sp. 1P06PA]|uniref:class I adenylate-forming enzyme family protein n=1 Tax=Sphingomonas sp. 1P06PA TaxID=554121 RepID=UPI0039A683BE
MGQPQLDQPPLLFTDMIRINAARFGAKPAAICDDDVLSWSDFDLRTNRVANALIAEGLAKGDKVALVLNSSIAMFELIWGTVKAGGVIVPLNIMMSADGLAGTIDNCDARFIVAEPATRASVDVIREQLGKIKADGYFTLGEADDKWRAIAPLIDAAPYAECGVPLAMSDPMNIIYSSGSTGAPKGIEHSQWARHIYTFGFGYGLEMTRFSVPICSTPLYTNGTWITMLPAVYLGGTTVLMTKFSAERFLATVALHGCTHAFAVPTQFIVLLESGEISRHDTSSLKVLMSGGQAIATTTVEQMKQQLPHVRLYECYGITEGFSTLASPEDKALPGKEKTVGLALFGGEIVILNDGGNVLPPGEVGDITGYGPALMTGYYRNQQATERMIWRDPRGRTFLRSGDLGRMDEDGYLYIAGRVKDMIKSGGINVYASDIEDVFMRHPAVAEVAAIGVPHDRWIETPLLLAILREGHAIDPEELRAWGNAQLGKWQRVSAVEYRDEFPRATHDKILKRALRAPYWPD